MNTKLNDEPHYGIAVQDAWAFSPIHHRLSGTSMPRSSQPNEGRQTV
jgi:hypothetical protein